MCLRVLPDEGMQSRLPPEVAVAQPGLLLFQFYCSLPYYSKGGRRMASVDYLITTRAIKDGQFVAQVGSTRYLRVPSRIAIPTPEMAAPNARDQALWVKEVRDLADGDPNQNSISIAGDILVFIHGYNNDLDVIMKRQRQLAKDLKAEGWKGVVIGFDWPSDNETLGYWEDRSRAAEVAVELVSNGVLVLAQGQKNGCITNVHLL